MVQALADRRQYGRQYYAEHCDALNARKRRRYAEHRDGLSAQKRRAYRENPDKYVRRSRRWRQQHLKQHQESNRRYYSKNRERILAASKQRHWQKKAEDPCALTRAARGRYLKREYGLSLEQYDRLLRKQKNLCALCRQPMKHGGRITAKHAVVDHDHKTGRVRGILHAQCNSWLALLDNDSRLLFRLAKYLNKFRKS
ncbi:hypothetical protein LCGC14_0399720 [marine sediment metagenome]|uniref:Recombination endonuclease VII n=1 Tax=marine sediment metagenome TaxID=412755 RepID=A0A0F9SX82_9ZZZZ